MTIDELRASVHGSVPPAALPPLLLALWHDGRGEWTHAHEVAQAVDTPAGAWVHAYLHRKEGDIDNARYWYRRAGRQEATGSLDAEWDAIAGALLAEA